MVRYLLSSKISTAEAVGGATLRAGVGPVNRVRRIFGVVPEISRDRRPLLWTRRRLLCGALDGLADGVEDAADLSAEEDQGDDRDDRDQGKDQRVFGKTLAFFISTEVSNKSG